MDITHTYRGDMALTLQSPAGTVVNLKAAQGSDDRHNVLGVFQISLPLTQEGALDSLVGESSLGDWKMTVTDSFPVDTGTLNSWGLIFVSVTPGDEVTNQGVSSPIVLSGTAGVCKMMRPTRVR